MSSYVALLRGINVGGKHSVAMADLRALAESLGYHDVRTLIQSGNLVFSSSERPEPVALSAALETAYGFVIPVVVRSAAEMAAVLEQNPFGELDESKFHVGFMSERPSQDVVEALEGNVFLPERFEVVGTETYYFLPDGMARTKLPGYLDRRLKVPMTVRNWNTVNALVEMTKE